MITFITRNPDGSLFAQGEYRSGEYSYHFRQPLHPGHPWQGIPWEELITLSAIETDDDGKVIRTWPNEVPESNPGTTPPPFIRRP